MEDTRSVITTKLLNELETEPTIKDAMKAYITRGYIKSRRRKRISIENLDA